MRTIALFGGTFDPVHYGHIKTSINIQLNFRFDAFCFVPCKAQVLKGTASASTEQRVTMLELALKPYPQFSIDLREILRETPSYTIETLESVREEQNDVVSITLIVGYDAFINMPQWHQWEKILTLANIMVIDRHAHHHIDEPRAIKELLTKHQIQDPNELTTHQAGAILYFDAGDYPISSSMIREKIRLQQGLEEILPQSVIQYINQQGLYQ